MGHGNSESGKAVETLPEKYRDDLIRGAMAAQKISVDELAKMAGIGKNQVVAVRNGSLNIRLQTLYAIVDALGLTLKQVFEPKPEAVGADGSQQNATL
jgi:transcriptional regulator with XRE-family HTH domain